MIPRRHFLVGSGALVAAMGLPFRRVMAAPAAGDRKFIFVFAPGGWDPTRVFATEFDNDNVDMEADADRATAGGIEFVDHGDRPSVRQFFESNHSRTLVLNGVMVRSIAHEICTMITLTGTSSGTAPDWPAVLAASRREQFTLPHLVLDGPSFPGDLGVAVARTGVNGQLEALLAGDAVRWSDQATTPLTSPAESLVDRYLSRRAAARADAARSAFEQSMQASFRDSLDKTIALKDLRFVMDFTGGVALEDQASVAVEALSLGVSRCVSIAHTGGGLGWDTHTNNDPDQSSLWESLFQGLAQLMQWLDATPGTSAPTLADETTVVVLSEMGRTPQLNAFQGKDHWPYTSAMLVGAGITGDRVVGGFDDNYYGKPIDPATGELSDSGATLSAEMLGATLLAMSDLDPNEYVSGVSPLAGVMS